MVPSVAGRIGSGQVERIRSSSAPCPTFLGKALLVPVPAEIKKLVERFTLHREDYLAGNYNETQLRREFIDPMFKALGWDIDNESGNAEAYKDVIHEDAIKIGGFTKAPDYCFRIGGTRKFFLEAKKPAENIEDDQSHAYQLRRYAWSAKLPLSILTDFGEFAVYDCRFKPEEKDKASKARVKFIRFEEYLDRWDEIASIFSREAVLKGSFDRYADSTKSKRGTSEVDSEFLKEIENWRLSLARNLALRNPDLDQRGLNFAVQRIIDRLVFLRIAEDRGIEDYGQLQALLNGAKVYARMAERFRAADDRYNSGLFHFTPEKGRQEPPDEFTLALKIDDDTLKEIVRKLYYPDSPYEFSVLPADILGQVYEQFLGKVIRLTTGHQAKVEEKPEVKKAGGVYYTPTFIVDYIVKQTVGRLLEGKTPKQAAKLKVLDPACGSGSFLIGAYQFLLDWHRDWYANHNPEKSPKEVYAAKDGWRLTTAKRKEILLNNIFGVDIDSQAVEVTKLSLLLKVLEGENRETLERQKKLFHQRALPDLGSNIKCGNSLIGPDFYDGQQLSLFDADEQYRINAFNWQTEFQPIMKSGGFDAVIGNPPYVRQESLAAFKSYFERRYAAFNGTADLYVYFMEQGVQLLREGGVLSIIVSSSFLRATYGEPLRRVLKDRAAIVRIVDFGGLPVFANAKDTYVCVPLLARSDQRKRVEIARVDSLDFTELSTVVDERLFSIPAGRLAANAWSLKTDDEAAVFAKITERGKPLGDYIERKMFYGIKTGLNEAFEIDETQRRALVPKSSKSGRLVHPIIGGLDIRRFHLRENPRFLIVIPSGWTSTEMSGAKTSRGAVSERDAWIWFTGAHPRLAEHLKQFEPACRKRQDQGEFWWELRPCDYYHVLDQPKIIFPDICKGPRFMLDASGCYLANTAYCLGTNDRYLLGILNSKVFWFVISNISIPFGVRAGKFRYRLIYQYTEQVPIRVIDFTNKSDKSRHDRVVELVERMLALHEQLPQAQTDQGKTVLERQIATVDRQLDQLVYELYGLSDTEIALVEEATTH